MGIVFGKQRDNNVQVLTIKATQSLPAIRTERKFWNNSELGEKTRSTSYQTTLPGLPNLISSDEEEEERIPVPPPFTLPPLSQRLAQYGDHYVNPGSIPKVVAELSTTDEEEQYSSCVEDLGATIQREKTVVMREILGNRLDELRVENKDSKPLSSRESMKILSSRDSYRKTCLRSRKRARKNSCVSEDSSLTMSHIWSREEDTLSLSGDETVSDVRALIRETPVKKTSGCRISRKSTLNSSFRFNSSSDEGLPEFAIRYHLNRRDRRTRRDRIEGGPQLNRAVTEQVVPGIRTKSGARVTSAWHGQPTGSQLKQHSALPREDSYDASSELSSSDSEDDLNYANRFNTNPFLQLGSSAYFARQRSLASLQQRNPYSRPGSLRHIPVGPPGPPLRRPPTVRPDIINILPDYAKSSYNDGTQPSVQEPEFRNIRRTKTTVPRKRAAKAAPLPKIAPSKSNDIPPSSSNDPRKSAKSTKQTDPIQRSQFMTYKPPEIEPEKPRKQNDEFDDLDSAVEMFKLLL